MDLLKFDSIYFCYLAAWLFAGGLYVILTRTNAIFVLIGIELMLNAVNIFLAYFSLFDATLKGQELAIFAIVLTVCEVAIALAILLNIYRKRKTTELDQIIDVG